MNNNNPFNPYVSVDEEEEIVISGIAGQFPNSDNIKEFQDNLFNKMDLGSEDHQRWTNYMYEMPPRIGKMNNIEKFDAEFFNISAVEAHTLDPEARILLENTYAAIIDAGVNPAELQGTRTGIITAKSISDTYLDIIYEKPHVAGLPIIGCSKSMLANRISNWLNVTGPSYNIDTACSSSNFAMVEAYNLIRSGFCDAAIVVSVNLCIHPSVTQQFYVLGVLSGDGYCRPYDEKGTGYMRSDTATAIYLQKAKDARRIYATFIYGKTNCDGFKEEGITFPSLDKQKILLEEFYKECNVSPFELSYLEAHATGTVAGDPVELQAIDEALCIKRDFPLLIGSVKSNTGHSEAASGHCQIAKVLIAMETGIIPPTIHFKHPRKNMTAIIEGRVKIITEPTEWKGGYVGINSFGFGGANCHLLLKSNPKIKVNETNNNLPKLVVISGRTKDAVKIILDDIHNRSIDVEYISLLHRIHSGNIKDHPYRGYIIAGSKINNNAIIKRKCNSYTKRPICFIFSGIGSQCFNMGRALMEFPVFAKAIQKCDTVLKPYDIFVTDILINKDKYIFDNVVNLFVGLIGLQIGIVDLLINIGITPDVIMGHSIGELVCGYADGCLTVEETIMLAYYVGLAFLKSKIIGGLMAEINLDLKTMKNICPSDIDIACYNSSHNYIVSGPTSSIRAFLAKLQNDNISVKEISSGHVPFHSRYIEPARVKLLEYLNQILPQKASPSSKWLNMLNKSYEWFSTSPNISYLAKYYTNSLLTPVVFSEAMRFIPNDAVTIEIAPHDILQYILNDSLNATVTNVALYKFSHKPNVEIFLHGIGQLYNAGLQLQIANLYPEVKFPVSRSTPMISHLMRWDHSEDWYVYHYYSQRKVENGEIIVTINLLEEEFSYMIGHVVNRKNLLPAAGYLFLIWQMISWLKKQNVLDVSIVFEDVNFLRSTLLSKENPVNLILITQKDSCKFEIIEGESVVVTGTVRIPVNIEDEKICNTFIDRNDNDKEEMNIKDIYKELKLRGYQYTNEFRGLRSASITGKNGHIAWTDNWVTFMDNILQMMILGQDSRSLFVPTKIRKAVIDPKSHIKYIEVLSNENKQVLVQNYKHLDVLISGGIEIHGLVATAISRRQNVANPVLEEYKFVAHRDLNMTSLQDAIRMSVHVALECHNMINVKIIEFIESSDEVMPENLNSLHVYKILDDLPQICYNIKIVTSNERFKDISLPDNISTMEFDKLTKNENCLMIIGFGILTKNRNDLYEQLLSAIMPRGFLLTLEELDAIYDYSCLDKYGLKVILEKRTNDKTIILLRKIQDFKTNQQIVHVNNYEFSWINEIKSFMNVENDNINTRIIIVAEGDFECGLLGLVNCLRKEPGGEMIRSVFIQDGDAPAFSLQESLYMRQLQLDLPINVIRSGIWGSYRHFPLSLLEPKLVQNAYVSQMVRGDLSTLCWMQSRISFVNNNKENLVRVVYASINFRDVMIASGRLAIESITTERNNNSLIGMEFAGFNKTGQRIMGLCSTGGMTNILITDKYLSWIIPDMWTMEDAATVPCVYGTCYYALYLNGKMKKDDKILIHSGTGGVGQAAIYLALYEGCEVFTTVGSIEKRDFIRKTFPSIPEDHIGNSRDTSFEQMIIQGTKGRGVNIVLNSLAEEKLQASVRCLAKGGRFLEIGKFDMVSNNLLEIFAFSKGISFHGILLEKLFSAEPESKTILRNKLIEGLKNGAIKPLYRKVFEKHEIETAFRYMAAGKHIGKIMIKVQKEIELEAPILAHPRYYCLEHKCYIVIGGLGGFGLELIDWLILRGARNLVLISRTGIKNGYQQSRITLWQSYGVNVQIVTSADTSKYEDCKSILQFAEEQGPVDAIFNLAVVLKDDIFKNQSPQAFEDSFISKAWTTKRMDELSRTICPQLRHFVVFSSVSCGRGNAGQTNYGMANSVMERICERRMKEGLHGLAIQWGAIGDVGLVADMQEDDKELVIGGTLQQEISSCLDTLEAFLLQDRSIVSSMVVAEKKKGSGEATNPFEAVVNIMGLKNPNMAAPNISLAELGMDSMMAVEIKQTLEREFDILLTAQDIRNLTFAKLRKLTNTSEQEKIYREDDTEANVNDLDGLKILTRKLNDSDLSQDIYVKLDTERKVAGSEIFLIPGIDGCASVYKLIGSKIKSSAICLQHGVLNMPDVTRSVMKSAAYLLPHVLEKIQSQKEFLIIGYSFGSLIAIELARLLEAKNFFGRLLLIDGAPDQMKFFAEKFFYHTTEQELQNSILLNLINMYLDPNNEMLALELNKCNTWEEKFEFLSARFSKDINELTVENQKLLCSTIYDHIIAIQDYNITLLPRLKSSIILLKPTLTSITLTKEDYGLHKITESAIQIRYVEGTHVTMMNNDEVVSLINELL